jgi:hypothetical protein
MISEIYDALRDAGTSEGKAREAAEVIANVETRRQDLTHEFVSMRGEFAAFKWMLATSLTLTPLVLGKLFIR